MLQEAERTGAGVVGAQELRLPAGWREVMLRMHPLDVNRAIKQKIAHYVCHGTSLISRSAAKLVGGFDASLQVTADTDFILRLSQTCRIVNLPVAYYYRRMRPGSRMSSMDTGYGSALRNQEREFIFERARRLIESCRLGPAQALAVAAQTPAIEFQYILGPQLSRRSW
jgi:hypothetical protein